MKIKLIAVFAAFTLILLGGFSFSPKISAIDVLNNACSGGKVQGGNGNGSSVCSGYNNHSGDNANSNSALNTINLAANIVASLAGAAAVIMIIVSGLSLATSGGNAESAAKARRRMLNASIGLLIVAMAYAIATFVINNVVK